MNCVMCNSNIFWLVFGVGVSLMFWLGSGIRMYFIFRCYEDIIVSVVWVCKICMD